MNSRVVHDREEIAARWAALESAFDAVAELSYDALTDAELVPFVDRIDRLTRRLPAVKRPLLGPAVPDRHDEHGVDTFIWPPADTSTWPPVGTFSWPRTSKCLCGFVIRLRSRGFRPSHGCPRYAPSATAG